MAPPPTPNSGESLASELNRWPDQPRGLCFSSPCVSLVYLAARLSRAMISGDVKGFSSSISDVFLCRSLATLPHNPDRCLMPPWHFPKQDALLQRSHVAVLVVAHSGTVLALARVL